MAVFSSYRHARDTLSKAMDQRSAIALMLHITISLLTQLLDVQKLHVSDVGE